MNNHLESTKYGLAIHTSSPQLGLALNNFAGQKRFKTWDLGREISTHLQLLLDECITPQTWNDLAFIAVAKGPVIFTGTRTGVVTARTLAQQLDIPLFAISTLAAIAQSVNEKEKAIAVQMPAQRNQLFVAIYQASSINSELTELLSDSVMTPDTWKRTLETFELPYQLIDTPEDLGTTVNHILALAYNEWQKGNRPYWSEALPFYGQHPVENKVS